MATSSALTPRYETERDARTRENTESKQDKRQAQTSQKRAIVLAAIKKIEEKLGCTLQLTPAAIDKLEENLDQTATEQQGLTSAQLSQIAIFGVISLAFTGGVRAVNIGTLPSNVLGFVDQHQDLSKAVASQVIDVSNAPNPIMANHLGAYDALLKKIVLREEIHAKKNAPQPPTALPMNPALK